MPIPEIASPVRSSATHSPEVTPEHLAFNKAVQRAQAAINKSADTDFISYKDALKPVNLAAKQFRLADVDAGRVQRTIFGSQKGTPHTENTIACAQQGLKEHVQIIYDGKIWGGDAGAPRKYTAKMRDWHARNAPDVTPSRPFTPATVKEVRSL